MSDSFAFYKSVSKLRTVQIEFNAKLIFPHDLEADKTYKHFPEFYS